MVMPLFCYFLTINTIRLLLLFLKSKVRFGNLLFVVIPMLVDVFYKFSFLDRFSCEVLEDCTA